MSDLFIGNSEASGTHSTPEWDDIKGKWSIKATARTLRGPTTAAHWLQHLNGTRPLGVVPIRTDSTCAWGCGDIDDYDVDALALIGRIETLRYPFVPCRSKSGGIHLFLFLREPEPAAAVQACVRDMMASLGHSTAEVFPKQTALVHERDQGNWMVMPYYGGDFGGKLQMQFGLKKGGGEMTLGEFLRAAEAARTTTADIRIARGGGPRTSAKGANGRTPSAPFADGPPCLQHLAATKVQRGGQDSALFMMGIYLKRAHPDDWRARLETANTTYLETPGDASFIMDKIKSLERKDYEYTCHTEPMRSFCNAALCRTRPHGVGEGQRYPALGGMVKYDSDPPLWFVDVGDVRVTLTTEDLYDYRRFCLVCLARVHRSFAPMKTGDWAAIVNLALEDLVVEKVGPELKTEGQILTHLTEYLTNRMRAKKKEELPQGRPWRDEVGDWVNRPDDPNAGVGDYYMSLDRFMKHLWTEDKGGDRRWEKRWVTLELKKIGAVKLEQRTVARQSIHLWRVPGGTIVQTEPLELPSPGVEKI